MDPSEVLNLKEAEELDDDELESRRKENYMFMKKKLTKAGGRIANDKYQDGFDPIEGFKPTFCYFMELIIPTNKLQWTKNVDRGVFIKGDITSVQVIFAHKREQVAKFMIVQDLAPKVSRFLNPKKFDVNLNDQ